MAELFVIALWLIALIAVSMVLRLVNAATNWLVADTKRKDDAGFD